MNRYLLSLAAFSMAAAPGLAADVPLSAAGGAAVAVRAVMQTLSTSSDTTIADRVILRVLDIFLLLLRGPHGNSIGHG
jgi:hypothetical protein